MVCCTNILYVPYTGRLAIVYGIEYRRKYSLLVLIYHGPTEGWHNKDKNTCLICRHSSSIQAHPPVDTVHYIST